MDTSGFPVESSLTKEDFPTFGAPTRQSVGVSRSTSGIARKVYKYYFIGDVVSENLIMNQLNSTKKCVHT